ncbi:MAG TPA: hemolysin III family protein [Arenibacter sp.]|nr:hemolysin III family protein [Arenibacter sp.]
MNCEATSRKQENLNTVSHGIGILLGLIGFYILLQRNIRTNSLGLFSILIYSATILLMFTVSTLYHGIGDPKWKGRLRILDHISIYFLIAGTYTPVTLILLENGNGWPMFYIVWGIALIGTVMKLFYTGKYEFISLLLYLAMGWLIILDFGTLLEQGSLTGLMLLFSGGLLYTSGIVFYVNEKIRYNHFIWHLFVLGGAVCHWLFIYTDIVGI